MRGGPGQAGAGTDLLSIPRVSVDRSPGTEAFWYYAVGLDPAENVAPAWFVLARKGDRLLELRYDGTLDLSEWFDEIAAMLTRRGEWFLLWQDRAQTFSIRS